MRLTRRELLCLLDEPYKSNALAYYDDEDNLFRLETKLEERADNIHEALANSFDWMKTSEGFGYWEDLHDKEKEKYRLETDRTKIANTIDPFKKRKRKIL